MATGAGTVLLPMPAADQVRILEADGEPVRTSPTNEGLSLTVETGQTYVITGRSRC